MKVLVSNDDGPPNVKESPYILPFVEHLEELGWNVKVCLPDAQKSWIGKAFLSKQETKVRYYNRNTGEVTKERKSDNDFYLLSNTPGACINIALNHLFKDEEFDLVIGGPNLGNNVTTLYTLASGTIGVALEAVLNKRKAVAVSFGHFEGEPEQKPEYFKNCCTIASDVIKRLYDTKNIPWPENGLFNINIPMVNFRPEVYVTDFHKANYGAVFEKASEDGTEFRFSPDSNPEDSINDAPALTDKWAIMNNYVSVTPMVAAFQTSSIIRNNVDYGFNCEEN